MPKHTALLSPSSLLLQCMPHITAEQTIVICLHSGGRTVTVRESLGMKAIVQSMLITAICTLKHAAAVNNMLRSANAHAALDITKFAFIHLQTVRPMQLVHSTM